MAEAKSPRSHASTAEYDPAVFLPMEQYLTTAGKPDPEIIVRTSGEQRLSGFLLWQASDATLQFDDRWWPDYDRAALAGALAVHTSQRRTFGRCAAGRLQPSRSGAGTQRGPRTNLGPLCVPVTGRATASAHQPYGVTVRFRPAHSAAPH